MITCSPHAIIPQSYSAFDPRHEPHEYCLGRLSQLCTRLSKRSARRCVAGAGGDDRTALPWAAMLAVKLMANPQGLPFLDSRTHCSGTLQLRDVRLTGYDGELRLRQVPFSRGRCSGGRVVANIHHRLSLPCPCPWPSTPICVAHVQCLLRQDIQMGCSHWQAQSASNCERPGMRVMMLVQRLNRGAEVRSNVPSNTIDNCKSDDPNVLLYISTDECSIPRRLTHFIRQILNSKEVSHLQAEARDRSAVVFSPLPTFGHGSSAQTEARQGLGQWSKDQHARLSSWRATLASRM